MLEVGTVVDNFTLKDAYGNKRSLYDYRGKKLILFFYPKNNTTSCTIEVCSFRDNILKFLKRKVEVVGISRDSANSHHKFTNKYDIPFPILSDPDLKIINYFGVANVPKNPNRVTRSKRITFILDENSKIIYRFDKVKPSTHGTDVLELLDSLEP